MPQGAGELGGGGPSCLTLCWAGPPSREGNYRLRSPGPPPGFAGNWSPSCPLSMGEAVLPPPHPGAPPSREPLESGLAVVRKLPVLSDVRKGSFPLCGAGAPRGALPGHCQGPLWGPASPDPRPGSPLSSERGVGTLPGGDTGRLTRPREHREETQGGGKWD